MTKAIARRRAIASIAKTKTGKRILGGMRQWASKPGRYTPGTERQFLKMTTRQLKRQVTKAVGRRSGKKRK